MVHADGDEAVTIRRNQPPSTANLFYPKEPCGFSPDLGETTVLIIALVRLFGCQDCRSFA